MRARTNKSGNIVFTLTPREAVKLGVSRAVAPGITFTSQATVEVKERFVCTTPGCYKAGHKFSRNGALGGPTGKGHAELTGHTVAKI